MHLLQLPSYMAQAAASAFSRFRQMFDIWVSDGHGQVLQLPGQNVGHNILNSFSHNQTKSLTMVNSEARVRYIPRHVLSRRRCFWQMDDTMCHWHTHAIWQRHEMLKIAWDKLEYCHAFMFRPFLISEKISWPWLQLFNELTEKFDHLDADTNFYWICNLCNCISVYLCICVSV